MSYRTPLTVRFGDVDSAGIVYYPRFLHFCHVAMEDFFRDVLGRSYPETIREENLGFPTVRLEVDFHRPLRYGDEVEVGVEIESVGRSSLVFRFRFHVVAPAERAGAEPVAEVRAVTVGVNMETLEKREVPGWIRHRAPGSGA